MTDLNDRQAQTTAPVLEELVDDNGPIWRCSGCGYTSIHVQEWQARVRWECLCRSSGQVGRNLLESG